MGAEDAALGELTRLNKTRTAGSHLPRNRDSAKPRDRGSRGGTRAGWGGAPGGDGGVVLGDGSAGRATP